MWFSQVQGYCRPSDTSGDIRKGIADKKITLGVFFDLEKAYDTTWRYGILRDLYGATVICLGATDSRSYNNQISGSLLGPAAHMDTAHSTIKEQLFEVS